jgi:hypothetical protein
MIDSISKTPEELNTLIQKYLPVLQEIKVSPVLYPQLAYIFDVATKYIFEKHNDLTFEWKAWTMFVLKELFTKSKIGNDLDITNTIDDFINNYNLNYESYCDYMASANEYDQQKGFVHGYILKKGK